MLWFYVWSITFEALFIVADTWSFAYNEVLKPGTHCKTMHEQSALTWSVITHLMSTREKWTAYVENGVLIKVFKTSKCTFLSPLHILKTLLKLFVVFKQLFFRRFNQWMPRYLVLNSTKKLCVLDFHSILKYLRHIVLYRVKDYLNHSWGSSSTCC